jgi:hypothetical protein
MINQIHKLEAEQFLVPGFVDTHAVSFDITT